MAYCCMIAAINEYIITWTFSGHFISGFKVTRGGPRKPGKTRSETEVFGTFVLIPETNKLKIT